MKKVVWLTKRSEETAANADGLEDFFDVLKIGRETKMPSNQLYRVFVTRTRLQGYCRMLIFDAQYEEGAEYFGLRFDEEGIADYQCFADANRDEIRQFLQQEEYEEISYAQGITLLRDALLQNYR